MKNYNEKDTPLKKNMKEIEGLPIIDFNRLKIQFSRGLYFICGELILQELQS